MSFLLGALCACQLAVAAPNAGAQSVPTAGELVALARSARYQQDSALSDYHAIARQRWTGSIGLAGIGGLGPVGRPRLAARFESVARMSWHHRHGAWAELIAARAVAPIAGEVDAEPTSDEMMYTIPYYPGRDRLWPMDEMLEAMPREGGWIAHPLDAGSDSLYRFALGGPLTITLPDGKQIRLRELLLRPVRPDERLVVGSLWIDISNGALVRAAYRPSVELDLWPYFEGNFDGDDEAKRMIQRFGPFRGNVEEIVVEHGLYAGRFWLPRIRIAHAEGTAKGARVTVSIEQTFEYERVNALAPGEVQVTLDEPNRSDGYGDFSRAEYVNGRRRSGPCRETGDLTPRPLTPDSIAGMTSLRTHTLEGIRLRVYLPCDRQQLLLSPELPGSIYSSSEELFTDHDLQRVRDEASAAFAISSQADWSPQPTTYRYGLEDGLLRYNRIEALSAGVRAERMLGKGYALDASARLGVADLEPNAELFMTRSSGHGSLRAGLYRRLDVSTDFGNPLGLSSSLGALLLGHDDGVYYRTLGMELGGTRYRISGGPTITWRLFGEQHRTARVETTLSVARMLAGTDFAGNVVAQEGIYAGAEASMAFSYGIDPMGTQVSGSVRAEAATGDSDYARGLLELRLGRGLRGGFVGALSGAAGTTGGAVPSQRMFFLGGAHTVHAHLPGSAAGSAFWLGRAELAKGMPLVRPIIFADMGWAGDRREFARPGDRLLAVGIGAAALDGLVRFDISRAMDSSKRWSVDLFLEVR